MCGFVVTCGNYSEPEVRGASNLIRHRGPDAEGIVFVPEIFSWFAHARLSIRDRVSGAQPMFSADESSVIVFNGELYNDSALRSDLAKSGIRLRSSHSDTEVLVEALRLKGASVLDDLEGMFAFVWADLRANTVLLARDRFGQKPIYYARTDRGLIVSSESTSLHALNDFQIDEASVQDYFNYGYLVPPLTLAEGMFQVNPGHAVIYEVSTRNVREFKFWSGFGALQNDEEANLDTIDMHLQTAVSRRLVSDRPTGMLLSGGIDSSLVAWYCSRSSSLKSETFSCTNIAFEDKSFDESRVAIDIAATLGVDLEVVKFDNMPNLQDFISLLQLLDEPLGDSSFLPTYFAFKAGARFSTVLLTGDGGDELFLGYDPFRLISSPAIPKSLTNSLVRSSLSFLQNLIPPDDSRLSSSSLIEKLALNESRQPYLIPALMSPLSGPDARSLFGNSKSDEMRFSTHDHVWMPSSNGDVKSLQRWFLSVYLPGSVLTKVDRASMLNSVEARPVFLDNDLLSCALNLRSKDNLSILHGKRTLRRLMKRTSLADKNRLPKRGFGMPVAGILRAPDLRDLFSQKVPGIDPKVASLFFDSHMNRQRDFRQFLYAHLSLINSRAFRSMNKF